jgi:hypothetical protein
MENNYFLKLLTKSVNDNQDNYYPHSHTETLSSLYKDVREEREKLYKIFGKPKSKYHN